MRRSLFSMSMQLAQASVEGGELVTELAGGDIAALDQAADQAKSDLVPKRPLDAAPPAYMGCVVIYRNPSCLENGSADRPALVTRVWSPHYVNLAALPDAAGRVESETSVPRINADDVDSHGWFWPPRV